MNSKALENLAAHMNAFAKKRIPFFFVVDFLGYSYDIFPLDQLAQNDVHIDFSGKVQKHQEIELNKSPLSFEAYKVAFEKVKSEIQFGNTYLCNLTVQTPIEAKATLQDIYNNCSSKYKILYKNQWLCFSPETFVSIQDGQIASFPMKGTIDARLDNAEQQLMDDPKELAEHYTIVDLIRNDLSIVSKNVQVEKFRYITKVHTAKGDLLQASSKVVGQLANEYIDQIGTIICKLLPAGSISGAPKKKTVEIISATENYNRGFYTGVAGVFDGQNLDSCVLIRFIENTPTGMVYKSGGGITKYSQAEKEYEEVKQKIYVPTA